MFKNRRRHERASGSAHQEVVVMVQEGSLFHRIVPMLVDYSPGGAQFLAETTREIEIGATALIHTRKGAPPRPHVIEAKIVWVSRDAGKLWFGCEIIDQEGDVLEF